MAIIINHYDEHNKHMYQTSKWGVDGIYIKGIKNNFYIYCFSKNYTGKKYLGKITGEQSLYCNLLENINYLSDKYNIFNINKYVKLIKRCINIVK